MGNIVKQIENEISKLVSEAKKWNNIQISVKERIETSEFTCVCPKTGLPDFGTIYIEYNPDKTCIELKALKMYVWSFRDEGAFHEAVTNQILADLIAACNPRFMRLTAEFNVRGGIYTTVVAEHRDPDWKAPELVQLP